MANYVVLMNWTDQGVKSAKDTVTRSQEATREDGNNVNLDEQTLLNVETNLRYQLASQAVSGELSAVRAAMRAS